MTFLLLILLCLNIACKNYTITQGEHHVSLKSNDGLIVLNVCDQCTNNQSNVLKFVIVYNGSDLLYDEIKNLNSVEFQYSVPCSPFGGEYPKCKGQEYQTKVGIIDCMRYDYDYVSIFSFIFHPEIVQKDKETICTYISQYKTMNDIMISLADFFITTISSHIWQSIDFIDVVENVKKKSKNKVCK